jgi:DNA-binding NtrC family response regulator
VSVNCSALSESLIESELFGHLKGSFTGAVHDRKGAFESARGGTLFLDEIGELPYGLQAKLLRAIENNEVRAVGSDQVVKTNVRIIAATHQNLHQKIAAKSFRQDLFYRLNVITFNIPSLLERLEDFEDIFYQLCKESRTRFSIDALERMKRHTWPGNIRELKNVVARAAAIFPETTIEERMLSNIMDASPTLPLSLDGISLFSNEKLNLVKEMEKQMILTRLIANNGNQRKTALDLGIPKSTLHDRIKGYNIDIEKVLEVATMAL